MSENKLPTLADLHYDLQSAKHIDQFTKLLNNPPHISWLKKHPTIKQKDGSAYLYLPIDKIEFLLAAIFGHYDVEVRSTQQLFNSVVVVVRIIVTNPVTGKTMFKDGIGAAPMQLDSGAVASDMTKIKTNAVQIGAPAAESYAMKDAAEKFGAIFGRDLNKKDIIPFQGFYDKPEAAEVDTSINIQTSF